MASLSCALVLFARLLDLLAFIGWDMEERKIYHEFLAIDLLRGFAAFAVIVWHYQSFYLAKIGGPLLFHSRSEQPLYPLLKLFYEYGFFAVQIFWSISGFVFASTYVKTRKTAKHFFVSRFARLYPLHLVTLLLVAAIQIFSWRSLGNFQIYRFNDIYHFVLNIFLPLVGGSKKVFHSMLPFGLSRSKLLFIFYFCSRSLSFRN